MTLPANACPVCGRSRTGRATATVLGREVHSPECYREASSVALTALQARWVGFRTARIPAACEAPDDALVTKLLRDALAGVDGGW